MAYNGIAITATIGKNTNAKMAIQFIGALGRGAFISNSTPETLGGIDRTNPIKLLRDFKRTE